MLVVEAVTTLEDGGRSWSLSYPSFPNEMVDPSQLRPLVSPRHCNTVVWIRGRGAFIQPEALDQPAVLMERAVSRQVASFG